ncbi:MAG TPA: hypothetical protein VFC26_07030 [Verrucomicrobiae bacterium]|nr:hypothetical protein [Verrucomicrobiae bacterium]
MSSELTPNPPPIDVAAEPQIAVQNYPPVHGIIPAVEAILREPGRIGATLRERGHGRLILAPLSVAVFCAIVYGLVVGTFSAGQQLWAAPLKVAVGLLISGLICLPSLYIFSCLSGSPVRLAQVFGFLAGLLALSAILLIGFAPVAWVFSASTESVAGMGALHLLFWIVATWFGLRFLIGSLRQFGPKSPEAVKVWAIIFILVQLQMMTALRPLIGKSDTFFPQEKKFFIAHWVDCMTKRK